jgi:hypothetical protein
MFKPYRLFSLVLSLILMGGLLSPNARAAEGTGVIAVSDAEGAPGETVTVSVTIQDNPGIIAAAMEVVYDHTQLKLLQVEDANLLQEPTFGASVEQYPYYLSWNDALASDNHTDDGLLVTLTFAILEDAQPGTVEIALSGDVNDLFNWDLNNVPFVFRSGTVTVTGEEREEEPKPQEKPAKQPEEIPEELPLEDIFWGRALYDGFPDLEPSAWYRSGVEYMLEKGYMNGMSENVFAPDGSVTRGQLVTILYRAAGSPSVTGMNNPFRDVDAHRWYGDAVIWSAFNGIVKGVTADTFTPDAHITREQLATMLWRYTGAAEAEDTLLTQFADGDRISGYARDPMAWAVANGLIQGVGADTLQPQGSTTRAQAAAILMRFCENV